MSLSASLVQISQSISIVQWEDWLLCCVPMTFCVLSLVRASGLLMESPLFYISWLRPWKTHAEETGSWRWSSLISEHVHWEIIDFLRGLHFVEGLAEHSPRQVAEFAYRWKRDSSSLGNPAPQDSICPENLRRGNDWCLSERNPLRPEELLFSQEQLEDTW